VLQLGRGLNISMERFWGINRVRDSFPGQQHRRLSNNNRYLTKCRGKLHRVSILRRGSRVKGKLPEIKRYIMTNLLLMQCLL
jgi:hypothetical protein